MFDTGFSYSYFEDNTRIKFKEVTKRMSIDSISAKNWKSARIKNAVLNGIILIEVGS